MTNAEMEELIAAAKRLNGDIVWSEDEDKSFKREFGPLPIETSIGRQLVLRGSINPAAQTLTFVVIDKVLNQSIYRLDLGKDHKNPGGELTGDPHKHRCREGMKDNWAYRPQDITATAENPVQVWLQFCAEFNIEHNGTMHAPPIQLELFP